MAKFIEAEGLIHIQSPIMAEYTLCGDAFDLASDESGYCWRATSKRTVTCPKCSMIIRECRHIRTHSADRQ